MKSSEEKARKLVGPLQTVLEKAQALEKESAGSDLKPQELRVLRAVGKRECPIMSAIADTICLSLSSVTGLIDRLVEKKLVKRDRSGDDRRTVQVELTDEGREAHQTALKAPLELARGLLAGLDSREQETLLELMDKAARRLEAGEARSSR